MNIREDQGNAPFRSIPIRPIHPLDDGPGKHRIGLLTLSNDLATERDFINMRSSDDLAIFVARVPNAKVCSVESLRKLEPELTRATQQLIPESRLDSIAYSCTSGTVVLGYEAVVRRIHAVRPGIPVVTPITAALDAFDLLDVHKIAVLTPYTDEVNAKIHDYLCQAGIDVCGFTSFQVADNEIMARISPEAIREAAHEADRADAQALFISCTAIRAVDVIQRIEASLGKPVVTANQALFWQAIRFAGYSHPIGNFGSLLTIPDSGNMSISNRLC